MNKQYRNIIIFLLITFLLPLLSISLQSIIDNTTIQFILYGIEAASPTIAVIIVLIINKKIKEFFIKMFHTKHLIMAIILPIIISCSTMFLAKLIFCFVFKVEFTLSSLPLTQLIIISWVFIAEELGWRGYLEPLLKKKGISQAIAPFIVGIVWCLWHYHYFLMGGIQVPIPLFFIGCIIESYIYSYLMIYTSHNLISVMTYHFTYNLFIHVFAINPINNNGNLFPYMISIGLEALILIILLFINKKNQISNQSVLRN